VINLKTAKALGLTVPATLAAHKPQLVGAAYSQSQSWWMCELRRGPKLLLHMQWDPGHLIAWALADRIRRKERAAKSMAAGGPVRTVWGVCDKVKF
jgi:hypothetical protein